MNHDLVAAAIQMCSTESVAENLATAERLVGQAVEAGAQLVVLPELFTCYGHPAAIVASGEPIPGPTSTRLAEWAARWKITLCAGSIAERSPQPDKVFNTCLLFGPDGRELARYRKLHLFDAEIVNSAKTTTIRESDHLLPGDSPVACEAAGAKLGLAICYDLRFPELFRGPVLAGSDVLLLPAAFTQTTGEAHWNVLLRARAIENQCFLIAANQCGRHGINLVTYGHSAIVDPWGTLLTILGEEQEGIALAPLSAESLRTLRGRLPALQHRRL